MVQFLDPEIVEKVDKSYIDMCLPAPSTCVYNETVGRQMSEEDIFVQATGETLKWLSDERDDCDDCAGSQIMNMEMNVGLNLDNVISKAGGDNNQECEFTRKGMCKTHNIKGNKIEVKNKKWKKLG